jgi:hypothetical protein
LHRGAKQTRNLAQLGAGVADDCSYRIELLALAGSQRQCGLRIRLFVPVRPALLVPKNRACAGQRIALGVDEALDLHRHFNIAPAIEPLSGPAFVRLQLRKLRLPKPQNVRFYAAKFGDISNFEVEAIRDCGWLVGALPIKLCGHNIQRGKPHRTGKILALSAV